MRWLSRCVIFGLLGIGIAQGQVSGGLQDARRHFLDANVNVLTFHSIDQLFATRRVGRIQVLRGRCRAPRRNSISPTITRERLTRPTRCSTALLRTLSSSSSTARSSVRLIETRPTPALISSLSRWPNRSRPSLIGLAVADGHIHSIDDEITRYVPELKDSAYDGVTIRQALQMRSGANYDEQYVVSHPDLLSAAFEESMVENRMPFVGFTRAMTRRYPPGTHYSYSTFETCVLGWVLERATKQRLAPYMTERLWKPAGMESYGFWMIDAEGDAGREFAGGGFNAVARDYARLGLMMLENGKAGDRQVVPQAWVRSPRSRAYEKRWIPPSRCSVITFSGGRWSIRAPTWRGAFRVKLFMSIRARTRSSSSCRSFRWGTMTLSRKPSHFCKPLRVGKVP